MGVSFVPRFAAFLLAGGVVLPAPPVRPVTVPEAPPPLEAKRVERRWGALASAIRVEATAAALLVDLLARKVARLLSLLFSELVPVEKVGDVAAVVTLAERVARWEVLMV